MTTAPPVRPRPPTRAGRGRQLFHSLIAVAGWTLFVRWWWIVLGRVDPAHVRFTGLFLLVTLIVCVAVTALWAAHNLAIFRRHGPRLRVKEAHHDFSRDRLGRPVTFATPRGRLAEESIVVIRLEREGKTYREADSLPSRQEEKDEVPTAREQMA